MWLALSYLANDARRLDAFAAKHAGLALPLLDATGAVTGHATDPVAWLGYYSLEFCRVALGALTVDMVEAFGVGVVQGPGSPWVNEAVAGALPDKLESVMAEKSGKAFYARGSLQVNKKQHSVTSHSVDRPPEAVKLVLFWRGFFKPGENM
jgi:hypothetical protein